MVGSLDENSHKGQSVEEGVVRWSPLHVLRWWWVHWPLVFRLPFIKICVGRVSSGFWSHPCTLFAGRSGGWFKQFSGCDVVVARIFVASILWTSWKTRNRACFDSVLPYDSVELIYHIFYWIDFWCELHKPKVRRALQQGARLLRRVAGEIFNRSKGWTSLGRRIEAPT